jgi:hypothetical protein
VHLLAVDAGGEAVQHAGPLAQGVDDPVADAEVVAREVEFRFSPRGEVHPVRVRDPDTATVDLQVGLVGHGVDGIPQRKGIPA